MIPLNKGLILKEIPLFDNLPPAQRGLIKEKADFVEYKKGQVIYQEGSCADAFYCVIIGRVMIYTLGPYGKEAILEYLHRGRYFGIISLLTDEPHSVTARAINDCLLLVIKKDDFDFILKKIPALAIGLSQTLSRRLKNKDLHQKTIFESTVLSVFSSYSAAGKTTYALNLALSLSKETHKNVIILDICTDYKAPTLPQKLDVNTGYPIVDLTSFIGGYSQITKEFIIKTNFKVDVVCFGYNPRDEAAAEKLAAILSFLVNDYHYIILDLPAVLDRTIFRMLGQSDIIQIITSPQAMDLRKTRHLMERLKKDFNFSEAKIKVIINEYKFSRLTYDEQAGLLNHPVFATLPKREIIDSDRMALDAPDCEYAKAVRRIARQLGDCLVGLALGVGVAYGFCHIGVLKVIEEEKIPIDIISGASIGAVIAGLWATGKSSQEIFEITREIREPKYIWGFVDLTIPVLGFIKGNKLHRFLKKYLGNKTFCDVKLPLKIVASDIRSKEAIILDKGSLVEAIMASCSMPGVFAPFKFRERILLDGGVMSPLPTEVLFNAGARKIIAVNVTPSREDMISQCEKLRQQFSAGLSAIRKRRWFDLRQYFRDKFKNNILEVVFSSIEAMQSEMIQKEAELADIVLHPDTGGLHWLALHKAGEFVKRGEEEARRNLDKIRQVINE